MIYRYLQYLLPAVLYIYKNGIRRGYLKTNSSLKEVHDEVMKVVVHEAKTRFVQHFGKNGHSFFCQTLESSLSFKYSLFVKKLFEF